MGVACCLGLNGGATVKAPDNMDATHPSVRRSCFGALGGLVKSAGAVRNRRTVNCDSGSSKPTVAFTVNPKPHLPANHRPSIQDPPIINSQSGASAQGDDSIQFTFF